MARQSNKDMLNLNPVYRDNSIKIDKVTISHEKSGSSKIRFSFNGQSFSHGVGRLDNKLSLNQIIETCKNITLDLRMKRFKPDTWKMDYFGIDFNSKVINFPSQNTVSKSPPIKSELTLIEIWENYLKFKGDRMTYNTLNSGIKDASNHLDYAVSIDPSCIYLDNIDQFVSILKAKYADSTLLNNVTYYNTACDLAMTQGKIVGNPMKVYLDRFFGKKQKNKSILCYSKDEIKIILDTLRDNPYPLRSSSKILKDGTKQQSYFKDSKERAAYIADLVEFKFLTGMRSGEVHALKWDHLRINKNNPDILIRETVSTNGKNVKHYLKNGQDYRIFPINDQLLELINRLPKINNPNRLIFPCYTNNGYNKVSCVDAPASLFKEVVTNLFDDGLISIPLRYYCTRHTFITLVLRQGTMDIPTLASITGHTSNTLMNNYYASQNNPVIPVFF